MNFSKLFFCTLLISTVSTYPDSQFTKKKTKLPSTSTLKSDCGTKCGDILEHMADLQEQIAKLQRELLKKSRALIEGENDGFFAIASKEELQSHLDKLSALDKKMMIFKNDIEEIHVYLQD